MAYASVSDVQAYFADVDFGSSGAVITTAEIDQWLIEDNNFINGKLEKTIDVSTVTSAGLQILKTINAKLTAHRVDGANPYFNSRTKDEKSNTRNLRKQAMDDLSLIENRDVQITPSFKGTITSLFVNDPPPPKEWTKTTII
ncbi:hypothetical protein LCGC14_0405040 [marine sediment metagenome]|uniref:Uncharacterized protein n=1 Tax=marine sediment metagenome TaxID=412755 RepID=A0A0F9SVE5_9ZZZZ